MASAALEKSKKKEPKRASSRRRQVEPTKRVLNLAIKERQNPSPKKWIPGVLIVLILAAVFAKFAVADRFARLEEREAELAAKRETLESMRAQYADYDEVSRQYNMYSYEGFDRTLVDRLEVMDMLKRDVFPACEVQSLSVSGRTINLSVTDLNLSQVSQLIATLEAEPAVESVTVYTASDEDVGSATLSVELKDATTIEEEVETN